MSKNVFEQMAANYDNEARKALAAVILAELKPRFQHYQTKTVLDYGGGTGLVSLELVDQVKSVLIMDSAPQMVEIANAKIQAKNMSNAEAVVGNLVEERPKKKVDLIIMSLVLLHIPDTETILQALYESLNEGGELLLIDFDENHRVNHPLLHSGFSQAALTKQLTSIGFSAVKSHTFYEGKKIFANEDATMFIASCLK